MFTKLKLVRDKWFVTDRPTDRQTDRPTDRQTDNATYRSAIADKNHTNQNRTRQIETEV